MASQQQDASPPPATQPELLALSPMSPTSGSEHRFDQVPGDMSDTDLPLATLGNKWAAPTTPTPKQSSLSLSCDSKPSGTEPGEAAPTPMGSWQSSPRSPQPRGTVVDPMDHVNTEDRDPNTEDKISSPAMSHKASSPAMSLGLRKRILHGHCKCTPSKRARGGDRWVTVYTQEQCDAEGDHELVFGAEKLDCRICGETVSVCSDRSWSTTRTYGANGLFPEFSESERHGSPIPGSQDLAGTGQSPMPSSQRKAGREDLGEAGTPKSNATALPNEDDGVAEEQPKLEPNNGVDESPESSKASNALSESTP